jgi:hypothetical protein
LAAIEGVVLGDQLDHLQAEVVDLGTELILREGFCDLFEHGVRVDADL